MDLLLRAGADPFLVDRAHMRTALHYAAAFGHAAILRVLLADAAMVDTQQGRVMLRVAKVRDMSGVCRSDVSVMSYYLLSICNNICNNICN